MKMNAQLRGALAIMAAVAGVGFSSGREMVFFFAQLGWASWLGIPFASLIFGLLVGMIAHYAQMTGAGSFPGVFQRRLGIRSGDVIGILYGLLMAFTAAVMLVSAGELGALTLPMRFGFLQGLVLALTLALMLNMGRLRGLPGLGLVTAALGAVFYASLALDGRPVRAYVSGETELLLRGSPVAAVLLATLYGALNAAMAGGVIVRFSGGNVSPWGLGTLSGGMLCALLLCANAALFRGGEMLLAQALPTVLLAARWGLWGFWISAIFMYLCAVTTLTAALGGLLAQMGEGGRQRRSSILILMTVFLLACTFGLRSVVGAGYSMLGWLCAFAMAALACYYDRRELCGGWQRRKALLREKKGC